MRPEFTMNPNKSFITSIKNSDHTADLIEKIGEVGLDTLFTSQILKDIPIIGTAVTLLKAGNDVSAYFFAKKVLAFLSELDSIPTNKRTEFIENECSDAKDQEHIGEITLMLIEKLDHPRLAKMLGKAFALMINGVISRKTFDLYAHVIKALNSYLIDQIVQCYQFTNLVAVDVPAASLLANYGLIQISILPNRSGSTKSMQRTYEKTMFGSAFYEHIIEESA